MTNHGAINILYLVHDLADPAVHKRTIMLQAGGATVTLAGFYRTPEPLHNVMGCETINLGRTYDAGFMQRLWSVLREITRLRCYRDAFSGADIIIARNLEMLAIGVRAKSLCGRAPTLVYESLDIHRLLLNTGPIGKLLRGVEGWLAKNANALITSSPAFVSEYFNTRSQVRLPIRLVENKIYNASAVALTHRPSGPPWKIGWFGAIRCRKSLEILTELVRRSAGNIEVIIRGRPALDQFEDFHKSTSTTPGLTFQGPYKNPDELASIYGEAHFIWAIDMFEEGLNSSWLLPNRIYEGGLYGSVPIALQAVETGRFITSLGIGVTIPEASVAALESFFNALTPERYGALEEAVLRVPQTTWVYNTQDCRDLVQYLRSLKKMA